MNPGELHVDDLFEIAFDFADAHPRFDDTFIVSLKEHYDEHGELSARQEQSLRNIFETWSMWDWADETGLI